MAAAGPAGRPAAVAVEARPARPVIACDLDEVLGQFLDGLTSYAQRELALPQTVAEFHSYHFSDVWPVSAEKAMEHVTQFADSEAFSELKRVRGAAVGVEAAAAAWDLVVVTSRPTAWEARSRMWLDRNFPGHFERTRFGNHYSTQGAKKSKADICLELGAVALIDDSLHHCRECASTGAVGTAFLFGSYPWNQDGGAAREGSLAPKAEAGEGDHGRPAGRLLRVRTWRRLGHLLTRMDAQGHIQPEIMDLCGLPSDDAAVVAILEELEVFESTAVRGLSAVARERLVATGLAACSTDDGDCNRMVVRRISEPFGAALRRLEATVSAAAGEEKATVWLETIA